ncbi:MAG: MFS transporter [Mucilaginibacter sp.]
MTTELTNHRSPKQLRIGSTIFFFISGFGYSSWASRIPTLQYQLHLNEAQLGAVLFALPIGLLLTLPITGRMLSIYSSRSVLLFGALFLNIILCFIGFATNVWQLVITLFCFGSARNLLGISINAQAVGVQKLYDKSIMAMFHGVWSLAGFAGAAVGYIMVYFNIAPVYHFMGISILLLGFSLYFFRDTLYEPPIPQQNKKIFSFPEKSLLRFAFICFACMACENVMYDWSGIYFEKAVHVSKNTATAGFVVYMIAMTLGRLFGDKLISRFGVQLLLKFSGIFIFAGLLLAVLFPYALTAGFGFILVGFGVSCIVPMVFQIVGKSTTMSSGTALASISSIGYIGFLIVPPFIGFVAQAASLQLSFGIIALLGGLIVLLVKDLGPVDHLI